MGPYRRSRIKGDLPGLRIIIEMRTTMLTAIAALVLVGGMAWAQESSREADLPVFGVGAGQIFRFSVAAFRDASRVGSTRQRCHATLSFRDTENRPIGRSLDVDLGQNESAFLDLDPRALGLTARQRIDFRPVASLKAALAKLRSAC
jgi:hypothetical protein